ncbi:hypothetical protein LEP1GSC172_4278 [Leptospira noguchii]|uniref:Uncharacterized protein n=2 Tax=Leptospira noguchii TaxID=28182 RepID=T0FUA4_9LEPT|nr:hypothetical protein LEP1GSC172_4278 [Leptospira noguchii]EQA73095.1 hypothetical protein LEP1GSC059_3624 [Leptospira noguchii serovar Panama str. CZ214]
MNVEGQEAPQPTGASDIWKAGLFRFFLVMRIERFLFLKANRLTTF